jgi:hypothetical protein
MCGHEPGDRGDEVDIDHIQVVGPGVVGRWLGKGAQVQRGVGA